MSYRITAVCLGNICRSPMAEAVIRARVEDAGLADHVLVDSAGTDGWHIGEDADPRALQTLRAAGYDLAHSGRQITTEWFIEPGHPDLLLTMDASNNATVTGLANGTKYIFRIAAVNPIGRGGFSTNSNSARPTLAKPGAPMNVVATIG